MSSAAENTQLTERPITFGASAGASLVAALGFSLIPWGAVFGSPQIVNTLAIIIGFAGIKLGMNLPQSGKHAWSAVGLVLLALLSAIFAAYLVKNLLPESFSLSAPGIFTQQVAMFYVFYLFFRVLIPVQSPRPRHTRQAGV